MVAIKFPCAQCLNNPEKNNSKLKIDVNTMGKGLYIKYYFENLFAWL